jgi:hypothetical protein
VIQHGYAHRNHAPPDERKMELGRHRDVETTIADLARGRDVLERSLGERFFDILVPPWNRIDTAIVARLRAPQFGGSRHWVRGDRCILHPALSSATCT